MGARPPDGLAHISYSAHNTYLECPKQLQLGRIQKAPQEQAWWFVGGSAVHAATEKYDRMEAVSQSRAFNLGFVWERCFEAEIEDTKKREPDDTKWRSGKSGERYKEWNQVGQAMVQSYIDWRQRSPYQIWTTPDGEPAIELDISGHLPGCEMEIKAYLDRIMIDPNLQSMAVIDLKSGKTKPKGPLQFGTYGALLQAKYGPEVAPHWGAAWMGRDGTLGRPYGLEKYTPAYVGRLYGSTERAVKARSFAPNLGACFMCGVKAACYAMDGPLAQQFDPDHPLYEAPF